ncbi:MAG: hypothetical protein JWO37_3332 [Acidimicrobiales bacterium]|jgi:hypothetical protein|nr:hypothetical protein [Acidimicrobiales bacterium]
MEIRGFRRRAGVVAVLVTGLTAAVALPTRAAAPTRTAVPSPVVTGPITGGLKGHPFNAAPFDMGDIGYVEQEFFFEGRATAYDISPVGLASMGDGAPLPPSPYRTRMIVRRPANPARFNGTVVLEWLNVTSGYDFEATWVENRRELLRDGYAYVAVTAQVAGASALKAYDPVRYAGLVHPGDQYSYDMFSQAAQALRRPIGANPMGRLRTQRVLAMGESQSGITLTNYINAVYPKVQPVIDGFAPDTSSGAMPNVKVPVLRIVTEFEGVASKQPDSAFYRQWDVAGASHADKQGGDYVLQTQNRDFGMPPGTNWPLAPNDTPGPTGTCLIGRFPRYLANDAALVALDRWVRHGVPPPIAPRMKANADGSVRRDANGNALGGLRLPAIDVPTASYHGEQSNECAFTLGRTDPFSAAKLRAMYGTHDRYVALVGTAVDAAVRAGFLLPADAAAVRADAVSSAVAR